MRPDIESQQSIHIALSTSRLKDEPRAEPVLQGVLHLTMKSSASVEHQRNRDQMSGLVWQISI